MALFNARMNLAQAKELLGYVFKNNAMEHLPNVVRCLDEAYIILKNIPYQAGLIPAVCDKKEL